MCLVTLFGTGTGLPKNSTVYICKFTEVLDNVWLKFTI
jgi:hypothetical protein